MLHVTDRYICSIILDRLVTFAVHIKILCIIQCTSFNISGPRIIDSTHGPEGLKRSDIAPRFPSYNFCLMLVISMLYVLAYFMQSLLYSPFRSHVANGQNLYHDLPVKLLLSTLPRMFRPKWQQPLQRFRAEPPSQNLSD